MTKTQKLHLSYLRTLRNGMTLTSTLCRRLALGDDMNVVSDRKAVTCAICRNMIARNDPRLLYCPA